MRRYYLDQHRSGAGAEEMMGWLPVFTRPGDRVFDVGANFGFYTIRLASLVGHAGRVDAFEPVAAPCRVLEYVIARLGLEQVTLHACAVTDTEGEARVMVPRGGAPNFYLAHLVTNDVAAGTERVRTTTLDHVRASAPGKVTFLKIDVEGAEGMVLRGATTLLREDRPVVMCEACDHSLRFGGSPEATFDLLRGHGYRPFRPAGDRLEPCPRPDPAVDNYIFAPDERCDSATWPPMRARA
jgi:FkbM family methyltransferase